MNLLSSKYQLERRQTPLEYSGKVDSEDLSVAAGTCYNSYFGDNKGANTLGWRSEKHSDLKNLELYNIHTWYKTVLKDNL